MQDNTIYTIGGMPAAEAWHFSDPVVAQELGSIISKLQSNNLEEAKQAYSHFYQFRRYFTREEFNEYIKALNVFREEKNFESIESILESIYKYMVYKEPPKSLFSKSKKEYTTMPRGKKNQPATTSPAEIREKEAASVTTLPKMEISIPENIPPKSARLIAALLEMIYAVTAYITDSDSTNLPAPTQDVEEPSPTFEEVKSPATKEEEDPFKEEEKDLFGETPTSNESLFDEPTSPLDKEPPKKEEQPKVNASNRAELEAKCRTAFVQLARKGGGMKVIEEFYKNFSMTFVGYEIKQLGDIKTVEDLQLCYETLIGTVG